MKQWGSEWFGGGVLAVALAMSGCALKDKIWGEAAPAQKTIIVESKPLPPFSWIFSEDDALARQTLELWKNDLRGSFHQVEGERAGFLSMAEINTLVRKGFIRLTPDPELTMQRVRGVLTLLGYKEGISSQNVDELLDWLESNRVQARTFYRLFVATDVQNNAFESRDLVSLLELFATFVSLGGGDSLSPDEMDGLLNPWIPQGYPHAKKALRSGVELAVSFFASFCGDRVEPDRWNGRKVGRCLLDLTAHFQASSALLDFVFGTLDPIRQREPLEHSATQLTKAMRSWLDGHSHPPFPTARVAQFASDLDIPAPYAFFKLTEWIPKLNPDSTEKAFSPTFFIDLASILERWTGTVLAQTADARCEGDWRACEFKGSYGPVDKLYNDEYATLIRSKTLGFVSRIALYDSFAAFLMSKFDPDRNGLAGGKLTDLITIAIRLMDSNAFAFNVVSRLQERPYDPSTAEASLQNIHRQGLSELAALASDLIPERGKDRRSFLMQLQAQIYDPSNELTYALDQMGITAFLYIYDLMTSLRAEYLKNDDLPVRTEGPLTYVQRRKVVEALPRMLYDHFPRIYNACHEQGFERTCGVVYTEVLPSPARGRVDIETYEMDMITLTSIVIESMLNRCDRNEDDWIGNSRRLFLDGYSEKACVMNVMMALGRRLMTANIIKKDDQAELLMRLVKRVPFLKWAAKAAMARGSRKGAGMIWRSLPPFSLFSGAASLGSVLSLAGEFMDEDKCAAIDGNRMGPVEDPGDELLYLNQLTEHYLPSETPAKRTSERVNTWNR